MSEPEPEFDALRRGDIVLAADAFKEDSERPWLVVNNRSHPFDGEQYVVMGLTTRTWYDERVPLDESDFVRGSAPRESSVVPHAVTSLQPYLMTDYVCRIRKECVDKAVNELFEYLR